MAPVAAPVATTATVAGGYTSATGEWRPSYPAKYAPLFAYPTWGQPLAVARWLVVYPSYLIGWNTIYVAIAHASLSYFQPPLADFAVVSADAASPFARACLALLLRNLVLIWTFAGGWHLILYTLRLQRDRKYDPRPQATGDDAAKFLFHNQVLDNVFLSCCSGIPIQTAFETLYFHFAAHGRVPLVDWSAHPLYCAFLLFVIPFWRELHFYCGHRLLHLKAFYPYVHSVHHLNANPGPWSGLAMHPIEGAIYFSVVLLHFFVPSHPLHFIFNSQHTALTPSAGHHGYEGPILAGTLPTGSYFHYLHHRYYEVNFGEGTLPLDWLFGTFRDGLPSGEGSSLPGTEHGAEEPSKKKA